MKTKVITIHRCSNCGLYEGERPQAGCCPRCGTASDPVPVAARVPRELPYTGKEPAA